MIYNGIYLNTKEFDPNEIIPGTYPQETKGERMHSHHQNLAYFIIGTITSIILAWLWFYFISTNENYSNLRGLKRLLNNNQRYPTVVQSLKIIDDYDIRDLYN